MPKDFVWYGGDNWVVLSREASMHILTSPQAASIISALRHSAFPEESVFQSVLMNSVLSSRVVNRHRRAINWRHDMASPTPFTEADWPTLTQAINDGSWFARKFEAGAPVLDMIDTHLLHHTTP